MDNSVYNEYIPDYVSPPGETLLETLESRGMTQEELSARIGHPKNTINEIIKGTSVLSPDIALQLERVFGIPAHFWNRREQHYRAYIARQQELVTI